MRMTRIEPGSFLKQYEILRKLATGGMAELFLGLARLLSGSTTLTILLHMLVNLVSVVEAAVMLGWV